MWAYNIETVLAEKIETILSRVELNGRMRDFYDIYLICTKDWKNINKDHFRKAIEKTFTKREYNGNPLETLEVIKNSETLKQRWSVYQRKYEYSKNIDFDKIIICIENILDEIILISI